MAEIQYLIKMLQSNDPNKRYEACEELRVKPELTHEALEALRFAANDENADVADAAKRAIELHTSIYPSQEKDLNASPVSTSAASPRAKESSRRNVSTEEQEFIKSKNVSSAENEITKSKNRIMIIGTVIIVFLMNALTPEVTNDKFPMAQDERMFWCFPVYLIIYGPFVGLFVLLSSILGESLVNHFDKTKKSTLLGTSIGVVIAGTCSLIGWVLYQS